MSSSLVINAAGRETRVALIENGHISEFYLERKKDRGIVGNIYKGRVARVLPGMQAAFIDIGEERAAFLYVGDVLFDPEVTRHQFELTEGEQDDEVPEVPDLSEEIDSGGEASAASEGEQHLDEGSAIPVLEGAPSEFASELSPPPEDPGATSGAEPPASTDSQPGETRSDSDLFAVATAEANSNIEPPMLLSADAAREAEGATPPAEVTEQSLTPEVQLAKIAGPVSNRRRDLPRRSEASRTEARIEDLLKVGQEILVQVSKDPIGTKGARVTCHISIPGRHLVFMPTIEHIGISRRIGNEAERRRLRDLVDRLRPPGTGFIVRTVAEKIPQPKLEADIRFLIEVWNETVRKNTRVGLLHADLDLILRATRDLFAQDVDKLFIDDREEFERVQTFVAAHDSSLKERVVLHTSEEPIFDAFGIEEEIKRATARKVWLKSGGYIIIDQAEALTAIDVNSGRYVGKKNLEDTITKINIEAAKEIVYQLRLRNIGGIIICDFIDMEKQQNRDKVFKALQEALGRDKVRTHVLRISELGLVEMTRKRVRESIGRVMYEDCGYCNGQGYVKSVTTVCYEIFRELRRTAPAYKDPTMVVQAHTEVTNLMTGPERGELRHLMDRYNKSIQVRARTDYHREQYDIYARPVSGVEIKVAASQVNFDSAMALANQRPAAVPEGNGRTDRSRRGRGGRNRGGQGGSGSHQRTEK